MSRWVPILAVLAVVTMGAASRASADDMFDCSRSTVPDTMIRGCSRLIASGTLQGNNVALAHFNVGNGYRLKGDFDRSIDAYGKAIQANPNYAGAYHNRGLTFGLKGDLDRAIADLTKAIQLQPNSGSAYLNRGLAYNDKGDAERAKADCARAQQLDPSLKCLLANRDYVTTCISVSSRASWQPFTFKKGRFAGYTTSGGWSVDGGKYAPVNDRGHVADAPKLEPFAQYKLVKGELFGALLFLVRDRVIAGRLINQAVGKNDVSTFPQKGETIYLRINDSDAALGDNAGSLRVCFNEAIGGG